MSGHTDAVNRTTQHQVDPERSSGVGVAPRASEPGFLALADAMYRRTYLELAALPTASACARLHTQQLLWEWGLARLADSSVAIVSELMANAVQATIRHQFDMPIALRLSSNGHQVLIEVWDADPTPPRAPQLGADGLPLVDAEGGRGLFLVAALSERWSCYTVSSCGGGKVVWAEVSS